MKMLILLLTFNIVKPNYHPREKIFQQIITYVKGNKFNDALNLLNKNFNFEHNQDKAEINYYKAKCFEGLKNWEQTFKHYKQAYSANSKFNDQIFNSLDKLFLNKDISTEIKKIYSKDILLFINKLKIESVKDLEFNLPLLNKNSSEKFRPMNASIIKNDNGYSVLCRTVNWEQNKGVYELILKNETAWQSKNFLLEFDKNFNLICQKIIQQSLKNLIPKYNEPELEDPRLFKWRRENWLIGAIGVFDNAYFTKPIMGKICETNETDKINLDNLTLFQGPIKERMERNWMPLIKDHKLYLIYLYDPYIIFEFDPKNNNLVNFINDLPKFDFSMFRGSAAPIKFEDGYLMLIHELISNGKIRNYTHRFLYLDKNFKITKLSRPFIFYNIGVEFCCGIIVDHKNERLIMTVNLEDKKAKLCFVAIGYIKKILIDLKVI